MTSQSNNGISASSLRILAMALMLIDHLGAVLFPGALWMRIVGRLAFPIFAFQTAEGYRYTRDFRKYLGRLVTFGLVSEIPFNLMVSGSPVYPQGQNVMFTLALGLLAIHFWEKKQHMYLLLVPLTAALTGTDYGMLGVYTVLLFHILRTNILHQALALTLINVLGFGGIQGFAVGAMLPIRLCNGEKGRGGRALQWASYCFYPLHMLILALI